MYRQNFKTEVNDKVIKECHNIFTYFEKDIRHIHSYRQERIINLCSLLFTNLINRRTYYNQKKKEKQDYVLIDLNMANYDLKNPKNIISKLGYTYHDVIDSIEILKHLGAIRVEKGYRKFKYKDMEDDRWIIKKSVMTKIYLNPINKWHKEFINNNVFKLTRSLFFKNDDMSDRPTAVLNIKKNKKIVKTKILNENENKKLNKINQFLIDNGYPDLCYQRKFSTDIQNENDKGFGRMWSQFHQITKSHREVIMEAEKLAEVDFSSCLLNILYVFEIGKEYEGDIYNDAMSLCGIKKEHHYIYRDIFKIIFITLLNCEEHKAIFSIRNTLQEYGIHSYFDKVNFDMYCIKNEFENIHYSFSAKKLIETISNSFPILNKYFFTKSSKFTQYIESEICIEIMNIMCKDNILPLSVHDSFLFPINKIDYYKDLCKSIFYKVIHFYKFNLIKQTKPTFNYLFNISVFSYSLKNKLLYFNNTKMNFIENSNIFKLSDEFT